MVERGARVARKSKETDISITLRLDGSGKHQIDTGIAFFDHMLTQLAVHGLFDLYIQAKGDLAVDAHHTVEDVGLALGQAFLKALGDRKGIRRMASFSVPMDESLANVVLDFSGRPYAVIRVDWAAETIGTIPGSLFNHFLESFSSEARCNLQVNVPYGQDGHHQAEAVFKALARALAEAAAVDDRRAGQVPSSKGVLF
ncbi:MAG: imidazoleglycerol-phosphate dehydratase HisB [Anaerolineaceae bacterium]|nr:imidazoleglycerol-phosphate dehydratase HisB [Anaerolineaceae bacterium]